MSWRIRFIPAECQKIAVSINNVPWTTWSASQGDVTWDLPSNWANLLCINVYGAVDPEGSEGTMFVYWHDILVKEFHFDDREDHDVDKPTG